MSLTVRERWLRSIPPEVLWTRGRPKRIGALLRWCESRGFRPTLAELEGERERRRAIDRGETPGAGPPPPGTAGTAGLATNTPPTNPHPQERTDE